MGKQIKNCKNGFHNLSLRKSWEVRVLNSEYDADFKILEVEWKVLESTDIRRLYDEQL